MGYYFYRETNLIAMNISSIPETGRAGKSPALSRSAKTVASRPAASPPANDKVELVSSHDRDVVLNSIKAKVKQGFYQSEEVTDDISEKLAQMFERS
jgi:hypothetical protein